MQAVVDALNAAFYTAFRVVDPTGKRLLVTAATEPQTHIVGFTGGMVQLPLSPSMRLDDAVRAVSGLPFERTDRAQPMLYAMGRGISADAFVVYTDSETWAGAQAASAAARPPLTPTPRRAAMSVPIAAPRRSHPHTPTRVAPRTPGSASAVPGGASPR
jgi:hypothetical protein